MDTLAYCVVVSALLFILCVIDVMYKYRVTSRGKIKIPCAPIVPILGNGWMFLKLESVSELHHTISSYMPQCLVAGFWAANKLYIMINDPKLVEEMITKRWASRKDDDSYGIFSSVADGLFVRKGEKWAKLRKPFMNLVHPKFIVTWMNVFTNRASELCRAIAKQQGQFEILSLTYGCALDIISETHMGATGVSDTNGYLFSRSYELVSKGLHVSFKKMLSVTYRLGLSFLTWNSGDEFEAEFLQIPHHIINERRRILQRELIDVHAVEPRCYTDIVLRLGKEEGANEKKLDRMAADMLLAGSDTTSVTLSSSILFLAMHPQYQQKVYDELCQVFGSSNREPTAEDLKNLIYMDMVINETLRHSGGCGVTRLLDKDVEIDGYHFPKGAAVFFRFLNLCKDPRWWKKPLEFYPDHFLPEEVVARPKGAFTPFSGGARNCPGQQFAWTSMKTVLSIVLRRFHFSTDLKFNEITYKFLLMQEPECTRLKARERKPFTQSEGSCEH